MAIAARSADLIEDRHTIIDFLFENLTEKSTEKRFAWLYVNNPFGPARVWLLWDDQTDEIIGAGAAFPRHIRVGDHRVSCWVLGDFCIREGYRSLGPAIILQRACLDAVASGETAFCYDYPSVVMMALYKRLGVPEFGGMFRYHKPLKSDRYIRHVIHNEILSKALSSITNPVLKLRDSTLRVSADIEIRIHQGPFGKEFSDLDRAIGKRYRVCGPRTREYLNWRYQDNPNAQYIVLTARRESDLLAFLVFTVSQPNATIVDLYGDEGALQDLVIALVDTLHDHDIFSLNVSLMANHPLVPALLRMGFYRREKFSIVIFSSRECQFASTINEKANWLLTEGDRDS